MGAGGKMNHRIHAGQRLPPVKIRTEIANDHVLRSVGGSRAPIAYGRAHAKARPRQRAAQYGSDESHQLPLPAPASTNPRTNWGKTLVIDTRRQREKELHGQRHRRNGNQILDNKHAR